MVKKLSQYTNERGATYCTACEHNRLGNFEGAHLSDPGHVVIPDPTPCVVACAAIYARAFSYANADLTSDEAARS